MGDIDTGVEVIVRRWSIRAVVALERIQPPNIREKLSPW